MQVPEYYLIMKAKDVEKTFVTRKITKWIGDYVHWAGEQGLDATEEHHFSFDDGEDGEHIGTRRDTFPKLRLGNLKAFRDWGYAGDYVEAMWMMLQKSLPDDYVICTGRTYTIEEFLDAAFGYIGIEDWSKYVVVDPKFYRPAEVDYLRGRADKANNILGWTPKNDLVGLVNIMMESDLPSYRLG